MPRLQSPNPGTLTYMECWLETPYIPGQCCLGVGVDCVRYVNACLAFMHGLDEIPTLPRFAQDAAFHNPKIVGELLRFWSELFPCREVEATDEVQLGDVLVVASGEVNETHVCIEGANGYIYHAIAPAVCRTSRAQYDNRIKRIYRTM